MNSKARIGPAAVDAPPATVRSGRQRPPAVDDPAEGVNF